MVIMVPHVEAMLAIQLTYVELLQIALYPQNLKEDIDRTDVHNNMINSNLVG